MGAVSGLGRFVLIVVNIVSIVVALGLVACGVLVQYVLGRILKSDVTETISRLAFTLFVRNAAVPGTIEFGPLTDGAGVALIVVGSVVGVLSLVGCCAACLKLRCLLITFAVCIGLMVLGQIILAALLLPSSSPVHDSAKEALNKTLQEEYDRVHINSFTLSSDIVFLAAQCCGVYGPRDFLHHRNLQFNTSGRVISPIVPPTCCRRDYIARLDWNCAIDTTYSGVYTQGCYETLQNIVESWFPWMIPTIFISLAVQVGEIIVAIMVALDGDNFVV